MAVLVQVTETHIKQGKPRKPDCCPIALAIADALDVGFNHVRVRKEGLTLFWGPVPRRTRLPAIAVEAMQRFDAGMMIEPFSFVLE